jgi:TM2 domain-containing membrane protein YozV
VTVGGALIGAIGFPIIGPLFGSHRTLLEHAMAGAQHLGFVALIWAPAIALVLCVMRAYRNKSRR